MQNRSNRPRTGQTCENRSVRRFHRFIYFLTKKKVSFTGPPLPSSSATLSSQTTTHTSRHSEEEEEEEEPETRRRCRWQRD